MKKGDYLNNHLAGTMRLDYDSLYTAYPVITSPTANIAISLAFAGSSL